MTPDAFSQQVAAETGQTLSYPALMRYGLAHQDMRIEFEELASLVMTPQFAVPVPEITWQQHATDFLVSVAVQNLNSSQNTLVRAVCRSAAYFHRRGYPFSAADLSVWAADLIRTGEPVPTIAQVASVRNIVLAGLIDVAKIARLLGTAPEYVEQWLGEDIATWYAEYELSIAQELHQTAMRGNPQAAKVLVYLAQARLGWVPQQHLDVTNSDGSLRSQALEEETQQAVLEAIRARHAAASAATASKKPRKKAVK